VSWQLDSTISARLKFAKKSGVWAGKRGFRNSTDSGCNVEVRHSGCNVEVRHSGMQEK
jgi:hypothetical protein